MSAGGLGFCGCPSQLQPHEFYLGVCSDFEPPRRVRVVPATEPPREVVEWDEHAGFAWDPFAVGSRHTVGGVE